MILRLSQKLSTKIKAGKLAEMPLGDNPYADWSCHLFTACRTQYIILCNTLINAGLAQSKGRSGLVWWLAALLLGPVATFLIVVLPPNSLP